MSATTTGHLPDAPAEADAPAPSFGARVDERSDGPDTAAGGRPRPGHLPGLDGLRAAAVIAVVLFHLDPSWLPGGFLGVDIFFVISGFLITTLLVRERRASGGIDLRGFWTRRARRLLPALFVVVPFCVLLARAVETDLLVGIRRQVIGAFTFTSNWLEINEGSNYFAATSPQLFMNFWSLAVEEQFYLVWPFVMLGLFAIYRRTGITAGAVAALVAGIGVVSAALMALTYDPVNPTRAYYGTDTHLVGLMLGASLALLWAGPGRAYTVTPLWRRHRRTALIAAGATVLAMLALAGEDSAWTFRLGIPLISLATAVIVLGAIDRPGRLRTALELPPLTWIGQRSYGIYLWHWPVILFVSQDIPASDGSAAYLVRSLWAVVVTLALADLSHRFVETPVRRHGFRGSARRALGSIRAFGAQGRLIAAGIAGIAVLGLVLVLLTAPSETKTQQVIEQNEAAAAAPRQPAPSPSSSAGDEAADDSDWSMPGGKEIDVFGDSMVVGSMPALEYYFPGVQIDAQSNRRWSDGLTSVEDAGDSLRRGVVLAFGTNAGTDEATVQTILDTIGEEHLVVLVNLHGDRIGRIDDDNAALEAIAKDRDNVIVADWDASASANLADLQADGIHPSLGGAHAYAAVIRQAFAELSEEHTGEAVTLKDLPRP